MRKRYIVRSRWGIRRLGIAITAVSLASVAGCECGTRPTSVDDLTWLVGKWHTEGVGDRPVVEEIWRQPADDRLLGVSHPMMGNVPMVTQEQSLVLETREGEGVFYVVTPPNRPATSFRLVSRNGDKFTFERTGDEEGWPDRVVYERLGDERIRVTASGPNPVGDGIREESWELHRSPPDEDGDPPSAAASKQPSIERRPGAIAIIDQAANG